MAGIPRDNPNPACFWHHAPSIHSSKLLHSSTVHVHHLPKIPQLPAMPLHSGAAMTQAGCTPLETPQLRHSSYLCFCTLGPTCNSCATVPSSSSQTFPITAGPTAHIRGVKQKATKNPTHEIQKPLDNKSLVILAEAQVQAIIQLQADEEKMALLQSTF